MTSRDVLETWNATTDDELQSELVEQLFNEFAHDELFLASAAIDRTVDDVKLARLLLDKVLAVTQNAVERGKSLLLVQKAAEDAGDDGEDKGEGPSSLSRHESAPASGHDERALRLLSLRAIALQRLDLLETYVLLSSSSDWTSTVDGSSTAGQSKDSPLSLDDDGDDDPWADQDEDLAAETETPLESSDDAIQPPIALSSWLETDPLTNVIRLVEQSQFSLAHLTLQRHHALLFPFRFAILNAIPAFKSPQDYATMLPALDLSTETEISPPLPTSLRDPVDWVETSEAYKLYEACLIGHYPDLLATPESLHSHYPTITPSPSPLTSSELSSWYLSRISTIDSQVGLTNIALELVQHGASQGVPGLDAIGEDLSLLARLVYDTPGASDAREDAKKWSLAAWRAMDERAVIRAYLARSTAASIAGDIRRLVMPYLYVLEARAERAGNPQPDLINQMLYDYILTSASLDLCAAIFESSKPIASTSSRIIKSDEDLARLALARLYGSEELDQWPTMSSIFECLPDWPAPSEPESIEEGSNSADTTLSSLTSFVQPSASRIHSAPPEDLYIFFKPLPAPALSRALDILDVHLECGEILARWGVPAKLAWFLQSAGDAREQRAWATRMARRAVLTLDSSPDPQASGRWRSAKDGKAKDDVGRYTELLNDMLRLVGSTSSSESASARGAFRMLGRVEVTKIFFSGLLSSGKFDIAKKFLTNSSVKKLSGKSIEELCLHVSREFYDNAESGNVHVGDMKLAYDCLSVPQPSPQITAERHFIEATSRITSFAVQSPSLPGSPITPLEIRLFKDRLGLVARVLGESEDAYKYPDIILELVRKLGYDIGDGKGGGGGGDVVAEVKTWAMMADSALQSEDFDRAADMVDKMVSLLSAKGAKPLTTSTSSSSNRASLDPSTSSSSSTPSTPPPIEEAIEVCWRTCFQLGRQSEYADTRRKLKLLGNALKFCPPENTLDILAVWRKVEWEDLEARKGSTRAAKRANGNSTNGSSSANGHGRRYAGNGPRSALSSLSDRSASLFSSSPIAAGGISSLPIPIHLSDYAPSGSRRELLLNSGADLAKQTLGRWGFDLGAVSGRARSGSRERSGSDGDADSIRSAGTGGATGGGIGRSGTPDVSASARHALSRGMGWLIGDDDE